MSFWMVLTQSRVPELDCSSSNNNNNNGCGGNQTALGQALNAFAPRPPALFSTLVQPPNAEKKKNQHRLTLPNQSMTRQTTILEGVRARVYKKWKYEDLPCLEPESDWKAHAAAPAREGLLFTKLFKTGSSTAAGITLRVARNLAARRRRRRQWQQQQQQPPKPQGNQTWYHSDSYRDYPLCKVRFDHARARDVFAGRDRNRSFLWTVVRDPTDRIVSLFYHFWVARFQRQATDALFQRFVRLNLHQWVGEHYQHYLSLEQPQERVGGGGSSSSSRRLRFRQYPVSYNNRILEDYDFIAITERMDESAVALSMLMGLSLADVLFLSSKVKGGYDDGGHQNKCVWIPPAPTRSEQSAGIQEFISSPEFQQAIHWDQVLHRVANQSLDLTIDQTLGRLEFEQNLALYRKAQALAVEQCGGGNNTTTIIWPCSSSSSSSSLGNPPQVPNTKTDCLWNDSGCGYQCLDRVAYELGLWRLPDQKDEEPPPLFADPEPF